MAKRFVKVLWWDATDEESSWLTEAAAKEFGDTELAVVSFGFVVHDTPKYLTLAADYIEELSSWGRVTKIPKGMVQSITDIPLPES